MRQTRADQEQENLMRLVGKTFYANLVHQFAPWVSTPGGWVLRMTGIVCGHQVINHDRRSIGKLRHQFK